MQLLLAAVVLLLVVTAWLLYRVEQHGRTLAQFARTLHTDTSAIFPCYSAQALAWSAAAVERAFTAHETTEWSDAEWESAPIAKRVEMATRRVHSARIWNLALRQRQFQLQANADVLAGKRTLAEIRSEEQEQFGNVFEVIVPQQIRQAIHEAISSGSEWPAFVERYASGEKAWTSIGPLQQRPNSA